MTNEKDVWGRRTLRIEAEYLKVFAKDHCLSNEPPSDQIFVAVSGRDSNDKNGVVVSGECKHEKVISAVKAVCAKKVPASLFFANNPCPENTLNELRSLKIEPDQTSICFGLKIHDALEQPVNTSINVQKVETTAQLEQWLNVAQTSGWFSDSQPDVDREIQKRCLFALLKSSAVEFCLAINEAEVVVGIAGMFFHDDTSLLTDLAVLPQHQRQLIGSTLVNRWIEFSKYRACRFLVLSPTPESRKLYSNFGFKSFPIPPNSIFYLPIE